MTDSIDMSAEDKFAVIGTEAEQKLFPHPFLMGAMAVSAQQLQRRWQFMWDFRNLNDRLYNDVRYAYEEAQIYMPSNTLLASTSNRDLVADISQKQGNIVVMRPRKLAARELDLSYFDSGNIDILDLIDYTRLMRDDRHAHAIYSQDLEISDEAEIRAYQSIESGLRSQSDQGVLERLHEAMEVERTKYLDGFLTSIANSSLLIEILIQVEPDEISVIPYHSHSTHYIDTPSAVTLVRPGRLSTRHWESFRNDIKRLEILLNQENVAEREVEQLLLANPLFLRGLNYVNIYPQVVLARPGKKGLRPDLIVEPIDSDWCDIVELKRPSERILVGKDNRASLAAGITSAVSQLREYSAYFDDRGLAEKVEREYGFRCHKPRLVVIVGRDPMKFDAEESRRAMTSYPDLEVVTYDTLLRAAKKLPLL